MDRLALGFIAWMILATWALFFRYVRDMDKIAGQSEEKILARLSQGTYTIGFLGYMMVLDALLLIHRH
jgi:hypothetical protein